MKVFISGIAGFLGSHLADKFLEKGHEVVGVDNLIGGYVDNIPSNCTFWNNDMSSVEELKQYLDGVDLIYHTACTAYEGLSVFSPGLVNTNTSGITVNLMSAAISSNVKRFVHCSSMARYGTQDTTPFTEDMHCAPQDPYGISKYSAELLLRNLAEVHGIHLTIAVPHNIIGPRQKYDDPFRNVASIMINLMLQGRQPVIYGDGKQVRCFSDIADDLDCLYMFAKHDLPSGEIFNIGPDEEPVTINQLAEEIADQLSFDLKPIYLKGRPQEVKFATCSADKIRKHFGYETKITLKQSLSNLIDYIKDRGVQPFKYHLPLEIINEMTPESWTKKLF